MIESGPIDHRPSTLPSLIDHPQWLLVLRPVRLSEVKVADLPLRRRKRAGKAVKGSTLARHRHRLLLKWVCLKNGDPDFMANVEPGFANPSLLAVWVFPNKLGLIHMGSTLLGWIVEL